jgi:hypothetical protein
MPANSSMSKPSLPHNQPCCLNSKPSSKKLQRDQHARAASTTATPIPPTAEPNDDDTATNTAQLAKLNLNIPGYELKRELGRGGQAIVLLAKHRSTGKKVAIKMMREGPLAAERSHTRFDREVEALAALNHPNIVAIIDTGTTPDSGRYIVMNYIDGISLDAYMKQRHANPADDPAALLRLFLKICRAVNAAHTRGINGQPIKRQSNVSVAPLTAALTDPTIQAAVKEAADGAAQAVALQGSGQRRIAEANEKMSNTLDKAASGGYDEHVKVAQYNDNGDMVANDDVAIDHSAFPIIASIGPC